MQFTGQVSIASCSNSSVLTPVQRERKDSIEIQELQRKGSTQFQELQPSKGDMGWKIFVPHFSLRTLLHCPGSAKIVFYLKRLWAHVCAVLASNTVILADKHLQAA